MCKCNPGTHNYCKYLYTVCILITDNIIIPVNRDTCVENREKVSSYYFTLARAVVHNLLQKSFHFAHGSIFSSHKKDFHSFEGYKFFG